MAEILGSGEVAEWPIAAVLKTAPENIATPRISARTAVFRRAGGDVLRPFPKNIQTHNTAQEAF